MVDLRRCDCRAGPVAERFRSAARMSGVSGYDVVGDVHGHADQLVGLLDQLEYRPIDGVWRHRERTAVFVGDLIDRGTKNVETVGIVEAMVNAGAAHIVLGNHEFNAICFATPDPADPSTHLRPRTDKNCDQHREFLDEIKADSPQHLELVAWFKTIPLWLELDGLRVVHACWDDAAMALLQPQLDADASLTDELVVTASRKGTPTYDAVDTVLKGPEIDLPAAYWFHDKDGHHRERARFRWWDPAATTLRCATVIPTGATGCNGEPLGELPGDPLDDGAQGVYGDAVPVIVGHYWRTGDPELLAPHVACVDYSVAKGGPLVAYRWDGERRLDAANFVTQPPRH